MTKQFLKGQSMGGLQCERGLLLRRGARQVLWALFCLVCIQGLAGAQTSIRVHSGGGSLVDGAGNLWSADQFFTGGFAFSTQHAISGTALQDLYKTERAGFFSYHFPVPVGRYRVTLHFAEIYFQNPGKRLFKVLAEGAEVIPPLDLVASAGPAAACTRVFETEAGDGSLDLDFVPIVENAKVSAIELVQLRAGSPLSLQVKAPAEGSVGPVPLDASLSAQVLTGAGSPAPADSWSGAWEQIGGPSLVPISNQPNGIASVHFEEPGLYTFRFTANAGAVSAAAQTSLIVSGDTGGQAPLRIRAGGSALTDTNGNLWSKDQFFSGGSVFSSTAVVKNTADTALFQTERFGGFGYHIPLKNGLYLVRFHFAEIWFQNPGERIFDVIAEGAPIAQGVDLVRRAGPFSATSISAAVRLKDGLLDLNFIPVRDNPKISALEILPLSVEPAALDVLSAGDINLQLPVNTARLSAKARLAGVVNILPCSWTQVSGPAPAVLAQPTSLDTGVSFISAGTYRFKVTVISGPLSASTEVSALVRPEPLPNLAIAPIAERLLGPFPISADLTAVVTGLSDSQSRGAAFLWSQQSGPGTATISNVAALSTQVQFSIPGDYVFRFSASVSGVSAEAFAKIRVTGDVSGQSPVRIHAGGVAYTDSLGQQWMADQFFSGGSVFGVTSSVKGTADPDLYKTERFGAFAYHIPLRKGLYSLKLHFAELWFQKTGERVFGVSAEGTQILTSLDLFKEAGLLGAYVWSGQIVVADGVLDLEFIPWKEYPKVSAIELVPLALEPPPLEVTAGSDVELQLPQDEVPLVVGAIKPSTLAANATCIWTQISGPQSAVIEDPSGFSTHAHVLLPGTYRFSVEVQSGGMRAASEIRARVLPPPDPPGVIRIRCGAGSYTDSQGHVWAADSFYSGGFSYASSAPIKGAADVALYQSERAGKLFSYKIPVSNGAYTVRLYFAEVYWAQAGKRIFSVSAEGQSVLVGADLCAMVGPGAAFVKEVSVNVADGSLDLAFIAQVDGAKISAIEIVPAVLPNHLLHVDIRSPDWIVDYSGSGVANVPLVGSYSHTHEFGQALTRFEWREGDKLLSSDPDFVVHASVGTHRFTLQVWDSKIPAATLSDFVDVEVVPASGVRGVLAEYSLAGAAQGAPSAYKEVLSGFKLEPSGNVIGGSPLSAATVLIRGDWKLQTGGVYSPKLPAVPSGGGAVWLDGVPWNTPVRVDTGMHRVLWKLPEIQAASLPIELLWQKDDGTSGAFAPVTHDETALLPQINRMPATGPAVGGEIVEVTGLGFFPQQSLAVLWGGRRLSSELLEVTPERIRFATPPGSGIVSVQVQTQQGISNPVSYSYQEGTAPIQFITKTIFTMPAPTQAAWGPDGRLYVASLGGSVTALELDDQYNVLRSEIISGVQNLTNNNVLGIGFSPWEPSSAFKIYLGHAKLFITGGAVGVRPAPFVGQVSALASPLFQPVPLITGLPSSNHDHGINGLSFDNRGQLYLPVGGNTNAGVPSPELGGLDESPFSEAILVASIREPDFDGRISYADSLKGVAITDQNDGGRANLVGGSGLKLFATGFRNCFDIVWSTRGFLYGTDNGPNVGFGKASLSVTQANGDPGAMDKVMLVGRGHYYGHANRNRGRTDPREAIYRSVWEVTAPEWHTTPLAELPSSKDGIDEYRSTAFGGALRGALLVQEWNGFLSALKLSSDGRRVNSVINQVFGTQRGLSVLTGPGGAILAPDYSGGGIYASIPDDKAAKGTVAYDIFPWRAPASGGFKFVIGGRGFGSLADTTVQIGTLSASVTSVTSGRIKGVLPSTASPVAAMVPVVVRTAGQTSVIPEAFRFLLNPGEGLGAWREEVPIPQPCGVCSAVESRGLIYLMGEGCRIFQQFDPVRGNWAADLPLPPVLVQRPSLVALDGGGVALIGCPVEGARWLVQTYEPLMQQWKQGAVAPWAGDAPSVAAIGGKIYCAGGSIGGVQSSLAATYDAASDVWSILPPLPLACSEGAGGSDGKRFFVFGGVKGLDRLPVQVFDPVSRSWESLASSPKWVPNRFRAVATFLAGEAYLIGGRTEGGEAVSSIEAWIPGSEQWRSEVYLPEAAWGVGATAGTCEINVLGGRGPKGPVGANRVLVR